MAKNKIKKVTDSLSFAGTLAVAGILALPAKILGAGVAGMPTYSPADPDDFNVDEMLGKIQGYFFGAIIAVCIFMILWGALDLTMAAGDETKVGNAKKRIRYAVIGLLVAAMATAIVSLVLSVTSVKKI